MAGRLGKLLGVVAPSAGLLLAAELVLRALGLPAGAFEFLRPAEGSGLYPPGVARQMDWGRIPYALQSDELGLRRTRAGGPVAGGRGRIVTVGDSVTDGFFVDDEDTYPFQLQERLDQELGPGWRVYNAARGGASLPKELEILRRVALPLRPQIVILTFVTNDVAELRDGSHERLRTYGIGSGQEALPLHERVGLWLVTRTAVGESAMRLVWRARLGGEGDEAGSGADRYRIPGSADHRRNARRFLALFADQDGIVHADAFPLETQRLVDRYLELLDEFVATCRDAGAVPVLVYFPSHPQVYLPGSPLRMRDALARRAQALDLAFLDLTPIFRRESAREALYLAPVDYHPTPAGNRVMAEAVVEFLRDRGLVH